MAKGRGQLARGFQRRFRRQAGKAGILDVSIVFRPYELQNSVLKDAGVVLRKWAVFSRRNARKSMKKGHKGKINNAPIVQTGRLRSNILWAYDSTRMEAIAGARLLPNTISQGKAPKALEYGGVSRVKQHRSGFTPRYEFRTFDPKPFMRPAGAEAAKQLPGLWRKQGRLL